MKKSRLFAAMTAALMAASTMSIMASAEDMTVTYTAGNTYTLSIPKSITIDASGAVTGENTLGVSEINVDDTTSKLQLKVSSNTVEMTRKDDSTSRKVESAVTVTSSASPSSTLTGSSLTSSTVIGEYTGITAAKNQTISFGTVTNADDTDTIESGTYTGTLVFTAEIVAK